MPNNIDNALLAAIRSMENAVIPAMNNENPLAQEQATIVTKLLQFLRERIPYIQQRDWLELKIYSDMVNELIDDINRLLPEYSDKTEKLIEKITDVLATPIPEPSLFAYLSEEIRAILSKLVRALDDKDDIQRNRIEAVIVLGTKRVLDLQRAWFVPTGLVANSDAIPTLERQFGMD